MKPYEPLLACILLTACSAPDRPPVDDSNTPGPVVEGPASPSLPSGSESESDTPNNDSASPTPSADAGLGGVFAGAPAYVAKTGPSSQNNRHTPANPAGKPCLDCHD